MIYKLYIHFIPNTSLYWQTLYQTSICRNGRGCLGNRIAEYLCGVT